MSVRVSPEVCSMDRWNVYLDRMDKSDLWGFVLLDCYYHRRSRQNRTAEQFLRHMVPGLLKRQSDPVAFHRVLLCVCVQLLGDNFRSIIDQSLLFLKLLPQKPTSEQIAQIVDHYAEYGQVKAFVTALRSHGWDVVKNLGESVAPHLTTRQSATSSSLNKSPEIKMIRSLDTKVIAALRRAVINTERDSSVTTQQYIESFRASGKMKGEAFVDLLRKYSVFNSDKIAIVSLGGADGSEIAYIMESSNIKYGLLLEKNNAMLEYARERQGALNNHGKTLFIKAGDVKETIGECNKLLHKLRDDKLISGVAYSINATLHELPTRGKQKLDLRYFVNLMVDDWKPFLIAIREPCNAQDWPAKVEIKTRHLKAKTMELLASNIAEKLKICPRDAVKQMSGGFVAMPSRLAVEVLFKLFHIEEYEYEIQESVTSIPPRRLKAAMTEHRGMRVEPTYANSSSFGRLYEEYEIECRNSRTELLGKSVVFVSLVGVRT